MSYLLRIMETFFGLIEILSEFDTVIGVLQY